MLIKYRNSVSTSPQFKSHAMKLSILPCLFVSAFYMLPNAVVVALPTDGGQEWCKDSPTVIKHKGRTCKWVTKRARRMRCSIGNYKSHCRKSCNTCFEEPRDSKAEFQGVVLKRPETPFPQLGFYFLFRRKISTCRELKKKLSHKRLSRTMKVQICDANPDIAATCPKTCKIES